MKKIYEEPLTALATYADMIMDIQPGTNNGGEYGGGDVDAHKRDDFEPDEIEEEMSDSLNNKPLW